MYQSKNWFSTDVTIKTVEIAPVNSAYVINAEKIMQCIVGKIILLLVFGLLPLASGYGQNNNLEKTMWQCKMGDITAKLQFTDPNDIAYIISIGNMWLGDKKGNDTILLELVSYEYNPPNITLLFNKNQQELQLYGVINGNELHINKEATLDGKKTEFFTNDEVFIKDEVYLHRTKWTWANKVGAKQTIAFSIYKVNMNADSYASNSKAYEYEHPNIIVYEQNGGVTEVSLEGTINGNELTFKGNDRVYVLQTEDVTSKFSKEIPNNLNGTEWEGGLDWIIRFKTPTHLEIKMGLFNTKAYAYSYEKPHVTYYVPDGFGGQQSYILEVKGNTMEGHVPGESFSALFNRIK